MAANLNGVIAATSTNDVYRDFAVTQNYVEPLLIAGAALIIASAVLFAPAFFGLFSRKRNAMGLRRKVFAFTFLGAGIVVISVGAYFASSASRIAPTFSVQAMLDSEWTSYQKNFMLTLSPSTERTVDPSEGDITTSEAESYTLLRAVWLDDQTTFDANWQWTEQTLQRPDGLFSWLYGQRPDGSYGILTAQNGENTAGDADSDIALALLFAYGRWQKPQYFAAAERVLAGIWNNETIEIQGTRYLTADNLETSSLMPTAAINPSYFSPYAYRIFAAADPSHPWIDLVNGSYDLINESLDSPLGASSTAELPPDWLAINKTTGAIGPLATSTADINYGYDAMRLPWRLALDWEWNHDPRDRNILNKMGFLGAQWRENGMLEAIYGHDGAPLAGYESPAVYGGNIGYFIVSDPGDAEAVYRQKLVILFDPGAADWRVPLGYYDANWAWFGTALYNGALTNLVSYVTFPAAANVPPASGTSTTSTSTASTSTVPTSTASSSAASSTRK